MSTKYIGLGSPQEGDTLGWQVIDELQVHWNVPRTATYRAKPRPATYRGSSAVSKLNLIKLDRPGLRLIEEFQDMERVILFDAAKGIKPGEIIKITDTHQYAKLNHLSSHGFGVIEAIHMAAVLNQLPSQLIVYGIGMGKPCETARAVKKLVGQVVCEFK